MFNIVLIEKYFVLFLIYSFAGWFIETTGEAIKSKKFINRGFLLGPICPVYGIGACLITALLTRYSDDWFIIFGISGILCGALEYFTSYVMEKLFKARWWDYSNFKLNINGRICLEVIALFAIAGVLIITVFNPTIERFIISNLNEKVLDIISISGGILLLTDVIISLNVMNKIKNISTSVAKEFKDNTEEISTKVRNIILEKSLPYRRIIEAFPQAFANHIKERTKMIVDKAGEIKDKTIENINNAVDKTKENINNAVDKTKENFNNAVDNLKEKTKSFNKKEQ